MRVVLDTNVVVSAVLTPGGVCHQVVQMVLHGDVQLCVDSRIKAEYEQVLSKGRFSFSKRMVRHLLDALLQEAQEVLPAPLSGRFPDPADRAFLEVAVAGRVETLITGNARHYPTASSFEILVMAPDQFLLWWREL